MQLAARADTSAEVADTFPKLLIRQRRSPARPARDPAQGSRHLADLDLGRRCSTRCARSRSASPNLASRAATRSPSSAPIGRGSIGRCARRRRSARVPVPIYADSVADEMAYVLEHAEVTIAVVEDQEQVDKIISISDRLTRLTHILYDEPRGLRDYDHAPPAMDRRRAEASAAKARDGSGAAARLAGERRARQGLRSRRHSLHVGHHRPPEGRDADLRQPDHLGAQRQSVRRPRPRTRKSSPICRSPGSAITYSPTRSPTPPAFA